MGFMVLQKRLLGLILRFFSDF